MVDVHVNYLSSSLGPNQDWLQMRHRQWCSEGEQGKTVPPPPPPPNGLKLYL